MTRTSSLLLAACLFAGLGAACGDDDDAANGGTPAGEVRGDAGVDAALRSDASDPRGSADAGRDERLDDGGADAAIDSISDSDASTVFGEAEALGMAAVITNLEAAAAELVSTVGTSEAVRSYAEAVATAYREANARLLGLSVLGTESAPTLAFVQMVTAEFDKVSQVTPGVEFDRAYLQSQVTLHTAELKEFDTRLLPSAKTPEVSAELARVRATIATHLQQAKTLLAGL
jgi:putative membrane protein